MGGVSGSSLGYITRTLLGLQCLYVCLGHDGQVVAKEREEEEENPGLALEHDEMMKCRVNSFLQYSMSILRLQMRWCFLEAEINAPIHSLSLRYELKMSDTRSCMH